MCRHEGRDNRPQISAQFSQYGTTADTRGTCVMEFDVFGDFIIPVFSLMLSLSSPVYQVEMICLALLCICIENSAHVN